MLSGFDIREHDIFLNDNVKLDLNPQQNKRVCVLCQNSLNVKAAVYGNKINDDEWENDLIYPCLCNIRTHRDCLKAYILTKKAVNCERCKAAYAVSGKKQRNLKYTKQDIISMSIVMLICSGILIAGIALIAIGFSETPQKTGMGIGGIIMIVIGILGIGYILWRKYFSNKNVDIFVNCKQTEIARHEDEPEKIVKRFLEQEEKKRSSNTMKKAQKLMKLLKVNEFENFLKLTTPRVDKEDKETIRYERRGSSNFLLPDFNHLDREEGKGKQVQKEIFISPHEVIFNLQLLFSFKNFLNYNVLMNE